MTNMALPDRYEIISELGSGGMGKVYLAHDTNLKKSVAIKVLNTDSLENDPSKLQRFQREAKAAGRMRHENLVTVMDFGLTPSGQPYLVMDYVDGPTLKQVIDSEGPFSADAALDILAKLASAIAHAHANGVVHRDLKTSNIVLTESAKESRQPVVVDFGIALMIEDDAEISLQSNLTRTNAVIGSPLYMSPEQVQGKRANERSDIYSLGCIFYECLTGYPPYQGETLLDTMNMHLNEPLPRIVLKDDQADLAARLNFVLDLTLAKNPSQRFATMEKLLESIEKSAQGFIAIRTDTPEEHQIDSPGEHSHWPVILVVGILVLFCLPILFVLFPGGSEENKAPAAISSTKVKAKSEYLSRGQKLELEKRSAEPKFISTNELNYFIKEQNSEKNRKLDIDGYKISSAKLALLATKTYLSNLVLSSCYFEDLSAFRVLNSINLKYLTVRRSNFDDIAAGEVAKFKQLKSLEATECPYLSSKGLKAIAENPSINSLEIGGPLIDDGALKYISSMPGLRMLTVKRCDKVSDQGISYLTGKKLTKLLLIGDYRLSNESLKYISTMKELTKLDIRGSSIADSTGDQLKVLSGLKKLKELHILKEHFSTDAIEQLQKTMPNCKIVIGEPDL